MGCKRSLKCVERRQGKEVLVVVSEIKVRAVKGSHNFAGGPSPYPIWQVELGASAGEQPLGRVSGLRLQQDGGAHDVWRCHCTTQVPVGLSWDSVGYAVRGRKALRLLPVADHDCVCGNPARAS